LSKQIENNVVQMTFDNKDFEKNISTSTKSIDKLNEELKFKDANKGFRDLEKYANSVNFSGLTKAIENINSVFTVTGNLSKRIIDDIAGYFESKIIGTVNTVRRNINYIMDIDEGVRKYEQYTTAMNTMVSNMTDEDKNIYEQQKAWGAVNDELEYVENHMDRILLFADETSYSFTNMADGVAKYVASNVGLEKASDAIMGVANVAAIAGQNATTATMSMQQLAQSFGRGYVAYEDWKQAFSQKNMVTKDLKKTLVDAAVGLTLDKDDIAKAKKALGDNYYEYFFDTSMLRQGWLRTNDVLINGLSEYSKASSLIIDNVSKLNDEGYVAVSDILELVHTYKDQIGKLSAKDFVSKIADEYDIQNVELMASMLEKLASAEYELSLRAFEAGQNATNFHEAIEATRDAISSRFLKILEYFIGNLYQAKKLWTDFANTLYTVFAEPLEHIQDGMEKFNKKIAETVEIEGELVEVTWYDKFWDGVRRAFGGAGGIINDFLDVFREFEGSVRTKINKDGEEVTETISIFKKYTFDFMKKLTNKINDIADIIEKFRKSKFLKLSLSTFNNILKTIRNIRNTLSIITRSTLSVVLRNLGTPLTTIAELANKLSGKLAELSGKLVVSPRFKRFMEAINRLTAKLMELTSKILSKLSDLLIKILSKIGNIIIKLSDYLLPVIDWIIDAIDSTIIPLMDELIDGPYSIGAALDWLGDKAVWAMGKLEDFFESVTGMSFGEAKNAVGDYADFIKEKFETLGGGIFDIFARFFSSSIDPDAKGTIPNLISRLIEANGLVEGAQNVIEWSGDALMRPLRLVLDVAGMLLGVDLSRLADGLESFVSSFTGSLSSITPDVFNTIEKIGDWLLKILLYVANLVIDIVKYIAGFKDTTGIPLLDKVIYSIKTIFTSIIDLFGYLLEKMAGLVSLATPAVMELIDWFGEYLKQLGKMLKDSFKPLMDIPDAETFHKYVMKALKFALGLFVLAKVTVMIEDVIFMLGGLKRTARLFGKSVYAVSDSLSGLLDSIAGDSVSGRLRMFALALFSFGYALAQIAKVGEMWADENLREGLIAAFVAIISIMVLLTIFTKRMIKVQGKAQKSIVKMLTNSDQQFINADKLMTRFQGIGSMLMGLGFAIVGISAALVLMTKAMKNTSKEDLTYAVASVAVITIALGIFVKLAKLWQNTNKTANGKGLFYRSTFEGNSLKGVGKFLLAFALSMLIITPAIYIMAKVAKDTKNYKRAIEGMAVILAILLAGMGFIANNLDTAKFFNSMGMIALLNSVIMAMAIIAGLIAGLALLFSDVINSKSYYIIEESMDFMWKVLLIIMAGMVALAFIGQRYSWKKQLAAVAKMVITSVGISAAVTALGLSMAAIVAAIAGMAALLEQYNLKSFDMKDIKNNPLFNAILIILSIFAAVTLLVGILSLTLKTVAGQGWKEIAAKVIGISLIIFMVQNLAILMAGLAAALAWLLHFESVNAKIWKAVGVIGAIMGGLVAFVGILALIGILMAKATKKNIGDTGTYQDPAVMLIKLAGAIVILGSAIALIAATILLLGKSADELGNERIKKGLIAFGAALLIMAAGMALVGAINWVFGNAIVIICGLMKTLLVVLLAVIAAVIIFGKWGDKIADWLEGAEPRIRRGFKALGLAMAAALEGFNEALPEVLLGIAETLAIILAWVSQNIESWTFQLTTILVKLLDGLTAAIQDNSTELGTAIMNLLDAILVIVVSWFDEDLAEEIKEHSKGLLGWLGETLFNWSAEFLAIPKIGVRDQLEDISKLINEAHIDAEEEEYKHQEELMKARKKGALEYINMLEALEEAEMRLDNLNDYSGGAAAAAANKAYWQNKVNSLESQWDSIWADYGVNIREKSTNQINWWDTDNDTLTKSRDWSKPFTFDEELYDVNYFKNTDTYYKDKNWYQDTIERYLHTSYAEKYGITDEERQALIEKNLKNGLNNPLGTKAGNIKVSNEVEKKVEEQAKEDGKTYSENFLETLFGGKSEGSILNSIGEWISDKKTKVTNKIKETLGVDSASEVVDAIKEKTGFDEITDSLNANNVLSTVQGNLNLGNGYTNLDLSNANISGIDSINYIPEATDYYQNVEDLSYATSLDTSYTTGQAAMVTASEENVSAITSKIDEVVDKLDTLSQALEQTEITVDGETTIAWLSVPIDKIIGKKQALNRGRRVGRP